MSGRTRKKGERIPLDAYYTDDRVALAITREVMRHIIIMDDPPLRVMEPHVGGGAFIRAFKSFGNPNIKYTAMDLNPEAEGLALADYKMPGGDFLEFAENWNDKRKPYDIVIGNPPFSDERGCCGAQAHRSCPQSGSLGRHAHPCRAVHCTPSSRMVRPVPASADL
jgi:predicted RNA methylase